MQKERWKPEDGKEFWCFDGLGCVIKDSYCTAFDDKKIEFGNCFKTEAEAEAAAEKVKALLLNLQPEAATLPKLTSEVFNHPDCPEWARYAVVNSKGTLIFFGNKPNFEGEDYGCWSCSGYMYKHIKDLVFDASDWQNSLIKRPARFPEWCKVGKFVWYICKKKYCNIVDIDDYFVTIQSTDGEGRYGNLNSNFASYVTQARLRPYNAEEMEAMVGLTVKGGNSSEIITGFKKNKWGNFVVKGACGWYDAKHLLENFTIDGKPCGVLEHLEDGEWVK